MASIKLIILSIIVMIPLIADIYVSTKLREPIKLSGVTVVLLFVYVMYLL